MKGRQPRRPSCPLHNIPTSILLRLPIILRFRHPVPGLVAAFVHMCGFPTSAPRSLARPARVFSHALPHYQSPSPLALPRNQYV
eukprot:scaffold64299_cov64-Phaeocystis_antarctica.AAC.2